MMMKKKSLIVAIISSYVISMVLVLTLVGYVVYIELKKEKSTRQYEVELAKLNARNYSKFITFSGLSAKIESSGPLKMHPIIEGILRNNGNRAISYILIKLKFLDKDNAVIYEVIFHPQEPSLGSSILSHVNIPYLAPSARLIIKQADSLAFKKILYDCPDEILTDLRTGSSFARRQSMWSGRFEVEPISLSFQE